MSSLNGQNGSPIIMPGAQQKKPQQVDGAQIAQFIITELEKAYSSGALTLIAVLRNFEGKGFKARLADNIPANKVMVEIGMVTVRDLTRGGFRTDAHQVISLGKNYAELLKQAAIDEAEKIKNPPQAAVQPAGSSSTGGLEKGKNDE